MPTSTAASFVASDKQGLVSASPYNPATSDFSLSFLFSIPAGLSATAWILATGAGGEGSDGFQVFATSAERIGFSLNDSVNATRAHSTDMSSVALTPGQQYACTITCDRDGNATLWLNGEQKNSLDISGHQATLGYTGNLTVGRYISSTGWLTFSISHLRIHNRLLTPAEIARQANVSDGVPRARPYAQLSASEKVGLVSAWDMQDGPWSASQQAMDLHGTNHLSLVNAAIISSTTLNGGFETQTAEAEALSNTGFETYTGTQDDGVSDTFTGWVLTGIGAKAEATATANSGVNAVKLTPGGASSGVLSQAASVVGGAVYRLTYYTRGDGTNAGRHRIFDVTNGADIIADTSTGVTGTTFVQKTIEFTAPATCVSVSIRLISAPVGSGGYAIFDTVSLKPILPATWTRVEGGTSKVQTSLDAQAGAYAVRLIADSSGNLCGVYNDGAGTLTGGKAYTYTAMAKAAVGNPRLYMGQWGATYNVYAPTSVFAQYTGTQTWPASTLRRFGFLLTTDSANDEVIVDNITLTAANLLTGVGPETTTATVVASTLDAASALLAPVPVITYHPSVLAASAAVLAPIPAASKSPSILQATSSLIAPVPAVAVAPSVVNAAAALQTPAVTHYSALGRYGRHRVIDTRRRSPNPTGPPTIRPDTNRSYGRR